MKLLRFAWGNQPLHGVVKDGIVYPVVGDVFDRPEVKGYGIPLETLRLLPPVLPSKVVTVGINYSPGGGIGQPSGVFSIKASTSVIGPDEPIVLPADIGEVIGEVELGVVIGRRAAGVYPRSAAEHILGYTCINDIIARELFMREGRKLHSKCKSFDTFCPIGPYIETDLAIDDLQLRMRRNGVEVHSGTTRDMIVKVPDLVSQISHFMTLLPGDVISTGTPHWPEQGTDQRSSLAFQVGDELELEIDGIGILRNPVVSLVDANHQ